MTKVISALAARSQFGQILRRARQNRERFLMDSRGEPQVVSMGIQDYLDTFAPAPEALRKIDAEVAATRRARRKQESDRQPQK